MSIANYDTTKDVNRAFVNVFQEKFHDEPPTQWSQVAQEIDARSASSIQINWSAAMARTRKWIGDKEFDRMRFYKYEFEPMKLHASHTVSHELVRNDQSGLLADELGRFVARASDHMVDDVIMPYMFSNPLAYDGVPYFSAAHQDGNGMVQSNLASSDFKTAFQAVWQHRVYREDGLEINFEPSEVWCSKDMEQIVLRETGNTARVNVDSNGAYNQSANVVGMATEENIYGGRLQVNVLRNAPNGWFNFVDTSSSARPVLFGFTEQTRAVALDDLRDHDRFHRDDAKYSVEGHIAAGAGLWQISYGYPGA